MNVIEQFLIRGVMLILGLWVGVGMVMALVMLVESWKRRNFRPYRVVHYAVTECPACEGTGYTADQEICGLCDGESAMQIEITE